MTAPATTATGLALLRAHRAGDRSGVASIVATVDGPSLVGVLLGLADSWGTRAYGGPERLDLFIEFALGEMLMAEARAGGP